MGQSSENAKACQECARLVTAYTPFMAELRARPQFVSPLLLHSPPPSLLPSSSTVVDSFFDTPLVARLLRPDGAHLCPRRACCFPDSTVRPYSVIAARLIRYVSPPFPPLLLYPSSALLASTCERRCATWPGSTYITVPVCAGTSVYLVPPEGPGLHQQLLRMLSGSLQRYGILIFLHLHMS